MSYYHAKRTAMAKMYLEEREAQDRIKPPSTRLDEGRAWIANYQAGHLVNGLLAGGIRRPPSRINWEPRFPFTPPKENNDHGEEIIEGEFAELADTAAASGADAEPRLAIGSAQTGERAAPAGAGQGEDGWLEEAYPQDGGGPSDTAAQEQQIGGGHDAPRADWIEAAIGPGEPAFGRQEGLGDPPRRPTNRSDHARPRSARPVKGGG